MQIPRVPYAPPNRPIPARIPSAPAPAAVATPVAPPAYPTRPDALTLVAQAAQSLYERIVRDIQNTVNLVNTFGAGIVNDVVQFQSVVANPTIYAILLHLPRLAHGIKWLANSAFVRFLDRIAESPAFKAVNGFFCKLAPVLGLICAPFDIRNCIEKWHDPKATQLDRVCTTIQLVTGIVMCAGGVLGFVLPWLGLPGAGAAALAVTGKVGLVNLVASIPSIFDGITGAFRWIGREVKRAL